MLAKFPYLTVFVHAAFYEIELYRDESQVSVDLRTASIVLQAMGESYSK